MVERSRSRNFKVCIIMDYGRYSFKRSAVCFSVNNMNTYMIFFLEFTKPDNEAIGWLYVIIHVYMLYWEWLCHGYFNYFMVILRSTMSPNGRPILEVAYGEMLFSLYRGCMGVELGKSGWGVDMMSPMLDIPGSTPVWAHCISFLDFYTIKINIYIYMVFKLIHCIK